MNKHQLIDERFPKGGTSGLAAALLMALLINIAAICNVASGHERTDHGGRFDLRTSATR